MSVSKLIQKPLSAVKSVNFKYKNNLNYKSINFNTAEQFNFSLCKALDNFNDFSVNNYSGFFIGKKANNSTWLNFKAKDTKKLSLLTNIKFISGTNFAYLKFDSDSIKKTPMCVNTWDTGFIVENIDTIKNLGLTEKDIENSKNYLFFIDFIPNTTKCYIKHINGDKEYYLYNRKVKELSTGLEGEPVDDLWFTTNKKYFTKFGQFDYILDNNSLILYFTEKNSIRILDNNGESLWIDSMYNLKKLSENSQKNLKENVDTLDIVVPENFPEKYQYFVDTTNVQQSDVKEVVRLRTINLRDTNELILADNKTINITDNNCLISVTATTNIINTDNFINSSWISYENKDLTNINVEKSGLNLDSQCLYHWEYNNIDENYSTTLDIIPLKNHISPNNNVIRGDYMTNIDINKPNVDFREYTTIETGTEQEFGSDNITLTYTYYNKEYNIKSGEDLAFSIDKNDISETTDMNSILYPYKYLNINDTNFIKNGANGSSIPFLADKVKKLQNNSNFSNNGRYLYTWLYQNKDNEYGIWLDRYYYPERISKYEALKNVANIKDASFDDIIDKDYINNNKLNLKDYTVYFDKTSDLMFEPGTDYVYSRIGKHQVDTIINEFKDTSLTDIKKFESGDNQIELNASKLKESGVLNLNFDMYLKSNKYYGLDIISNSATSGFSIKNKTDISPFIYTYNNAAVNLYNYNFEQIKSVNLNEIFDDTLIIKKLIIGKPGEDLAVITSDSVIVLGFDLKIKEKYSFDASIVTFIIDAQIADNHLAILYNDSNIYHRVINFNLTNGTYNECLRYNTNSILVQKDNKIYPVYSTSVNKNNYIIQAPNTILPLGLNIGDKVIFVKNAEYDQNYWYIAPTFVGLSNDTNHNSYNILSLTIYENSIIGLPYYSYTFVSTDTIYGLRERIENNLYQFESINIKEYRDSNINNTKEHILYMSYTKFYDISCDKNGRFALIKDNNGILSLYLFDKTKKLIRTIQIGNSYDEIFNLDAFNAYINGSTETYFGMIGTTIDSTTQEKSYHFITISDDNELQDTLLDSEVAKNSKLSNYSEILNTKYTNSLQFILNLQKYNSVNDKFIYNLNLDEVIDGWYNFKIIINLNKGIFEVYKDDELLDIVQSTEINKYF